MLRHNMSHYTDDKFGDKNINIQDTAYNNFQMPCARLAHVSGSSTTRQSTRKRKRPARLSTDPPSEMTTSQNNDLSPAMINTISQLINNALDARASTTTPIQDQPQSSADESDSGSFQHETASEVLDTIC